MLSCICFDSRALPQLSIPRHTGVRSPPIDSLDEALQTYSPSLLFKINENQLALAAAIMELTNRVEQRGDSQRMRQPVDEADRLAD
ncbi:hypothetical protein DOZ80_25800 [Pseudomonas fluorescens]|uniref:Uncharacterized protein n=1 Tax=Pseudomonas fluorescens TaxID=294 RepID=A0A327MNS6_PSEFL|nr:hypothetical protein DOZ80_25800 [Pseudomonas fluorescens]